MQKDEPKGSERRWATIPEPSRESDKNRIARVGGWGVRSLAINPLPKLREPVILPMRLAALLAVASRLMEPHPQWWKRLAPKRLTGSPTTLR